MRHDQPEIRAGRAGSSCRRGWGNLSMGLALVGGLLCFSRAGATQTKPLTLTETVRRADTIVVGSVTSRQSHWGDASQRWMATDYTFAVEDVIFSEAARPPDKVIVLTFWGGTIGGETQAISDMRLPALGEKLLVMLRPGWSQKSSMIPVVGFNHGLFSVVEDGPGKTRKVLDAQGQPLGLAADGRIVNRSADAASQGPLPEVTLEAFTAWLRRLFPRPSIETTLAS
jgi:hypothetical protein